MEVEVVIFIVREHVGLQELDEAYEAVAPGGKPDDEKDTERVDPETSVAVIKLLVDCPRMTDLLPPLARENWKEDAATVVDATVRLKVTLFMTPPPEPMTVIGYVPVGVEDEVAMFKVREQVGLQELDVVYEAVEPAGKPAVEKEMDADDPER